MSYVELIATTFGLVSVYLASRANILTWPTGIVNIIFLFMLFYQVQLYADMLLQVYFMVITFFGWYHWKKKEEGKKNRISRMKPRAILLTLILLIVMTVGFGLLISKIHLYLPRYFKEPASYPFADSFILSGSVIATTLLAKQKIENWLVWLMINVVCIVLYYIKGIYFLSMEYIIFMGISSYGFYNWRKQLKRG